MAHKIGHITIFVKNYEQAVKFYTESMGFELKTVKVKQFFHRYGKQNFQCVVRSFFLGPVSSFF